MIRALYSLLMWLAQPLMRRRLARRAVAEPGYAHAIDERLGHYTQPKQSGALWIHAVSLGEARAAAILIKALREKETGLRLLLTTGTATGRAESATLLRDGDALVWQPWDTPGAVRRFLAHFQPRMGVLLETEVWPNMAALCKQQGVPLVLANARLSEKSFNEALRLAWLARPAYAALTAVYAQTEAHAERLRALGANVQGVFGNLKFDATPDAAQLTQGRAWRADLARPVLMFASSREGEEKALLKLLLGRKVANAGMDRSSIAINSGANENLETNSKPPIQWLIVPRHPQRFDAVAALIAEYGFKVSRRSTWAGDPPKAGIDNDTATHAGTGTATDHDIDARTIWLGDSLGEMALYYGLADAALLGGSFEPLGGQNLIEAAACACPIIMGPHTFNFAEAAEQAQRCGAALHAQGLADAVGMASRLVGDSNEMAKAKGAAASFVAQHRGATQRTARALRI